MAGDEITTTSRFCRKCGAAIPPDSPGNRALPVCWRWLWALMKLSLNKVDGLLRETIKTFGLPAKRSAKVGERVPPSADVNGVR